MNTKTQVIRSVMFKSTSGRAVIIQAADIQSVTVLPKEGIVELTFFEEGGSFPRVIRGRVKDNPRAMLLI